MAYTVINKSTLHQNNVLYTGNGSTQSITGVDFQPDFTWIKDRGESHSHRWFDVCRGTTKYLASDNADAEGTDANSLTAFGVDGFSVGTSNEVNKNTNTYVGWNWKGGGTGSLNQDGSLDSTVSANTSAGFSVVTYTGAGGSQTVGHGLGVIPQVIIIKRLDSSNGWIMYNEIMGHSKYLILNTTAAEASSAVFFDATNPTSSVFSLGNDAGVNGGSNTYVAYCFANVDGYSRFGKYTGNGNASGPFVYTGFKPQLLIYKGYDGGGTTDNWEMHTAATDTYNPMDTVLYPNLNNVESAPGSTTDRVDFCATGFKMRTSGGDYNANGSSYIYMAWGQTAVGTNNIIGTAR